MKDYEAMIILKPDLESDALKLSVKEMHDIFKKYNCDVKDVGEWGKRPLSYEIAKKKEGIYYVVQFKSEPANIASIKREFSLNENALRTFVTAKQQGKG